VALVHGLEESHLGVTGQVNVLCAVRDKLHKSSCHGRVCTIPQENNLT
jgi:hypothetical protein